MNGTFVHVQIALRNRVLAGVLARGPFGWPCVGARPASYLNSAISGKFLTTIAVFLYENAAHLIPVVAIFLGICQDRLGRDGRLPFNGQLLGFPARKKQLRDGTAEVALQCNRDGLGRGSCSSSRDGSEQEPYH